MARGGFILLLVICFAAYWGWQYYKAVHNAKEKDKYNESSDFKDTAKDPDALEEYYKRKIVEMEEAAVKGITDAQEKLDYYKQQLTKLNNLKH